MQQVRVILIEISIQALGILVDDRELFLTHLKEPLDIILQINYQNK